MTGNAYHTFGVLWIEGIGGCSVVGPYGDTMVHMNVTAKRSDRRGLAVQSAAPEGKLLPMYLSLVCRA